MNEKAEANLAGFLKDIPNQVLIDHLLTRQLSAEETATLLSRLTAGKTEANPDIDGASTNKETALSADRFANAVVGKNVSGKLPERAIVDGRNVEARNTGGYYDHGPNENIMDVNQDKSYVFQLSLYEKARQFPDLMRSHIVSLTVSPTDPRNTVLTIYFFQDSKQIDSRGWCTPAHVSAELPSQVTEELLKEIPLNPDLLEDFYQKVFPDLDSKDGHPGMRRVKADGFYIVPRHQLEPNRYAMMNREGIFDEINQTIGAGGKHVYKNGPYGTGEAFT